MTIHRCKRCNYIYIDEEQKVSFKEVGEDYKCPKCHASKTFFVEKQTPK